MFKWFWTIFSLGAPENKIVCLLLKNLLPLLVNLEVFFFNFLKKKWVGGAMGNKIFYWEGLRKTKKN